jgi:mRNA interferase MazF
MRTELLVDPPKRGEIYRADLDPVVGHEQGGRRPLLVLSISGMNRAPVDLVLGIPLTTTFHASKLHVRIEPDSESGLTRVSYAMPEMARSVSTERFGRRLGRVPIETVETAAAHTGLLLGLGRTKF